MEVRTPVCRCGAHEKRVPPFFMVCVHVKGKESRWEVPRCSELLDVDAVQKCTYVGKQELSNKDGAINAREVGVACVRVREGTSREFWVREGN